MTSKPSQTPRSHTPRSAERAHQMRERAGASMAYETGVRVPSADAPTPESSPYERMFTGGETVMEKPQPLHVDTPKVILGGVVLWVLALVVVLLVPALHEGSRHWWPWACVAGAILGLIGWAYVRRGRGNAEAA